MKKIIKIMAVIMMSIIVFAMFQPGASAASKVDFYSYNGAPNGIDMGKDIMQKAHDNCKTYELPNSTGIIKSNVRINSSYVYHIYRVHIKNTGYYSFYTTGKSDTMLRLYREKMFFWKVDSYPSIGDVVDDGSKADANYFNAVKVQNITTAGYYYVVVRMISSSLGNYDLHVEPNRDLIYVGNYTVGSEVRNNKYNVHLWKKQQCTTGEALSGVWLSEKLYYTYEETLLYYWLLSINSTVQVRVEVTELVESKMSDTSWAMLKNYWDQEVGSDSKLHYFIDAKDIMDMYDENVNIAVGIASFIAGLCGPEAKVASFFYSVVLEIFGQVRGMEKSSAASFMEKIGSECKMKYTINSLGSNGLNSTLTAEKNLCVERWFVNQILQPNSYEVKTYGKYSTQICGQEYTYGVWS